MLNIFYEVISLITQWEVLNYMEKNKVKGMTTKEMAARLGVTHHLLRIKLMKLSRAGLIHSRPVPRGNTFEYSAKC